MLLGITRESYLKIIDQLGEEYDEEKAPPDLDDFAPEVHIAMNLFSILPDRVDGNVGFLGKDFACLVDFMEIKGIPRNLYDIILSICLFLNDRAIQECQNKQKSVMKKKA